MKLPFLVHWTVYGITTRSTTAEIGAALWNDKPEYTITYLPEYLVGTTLLRSDYDVDKTIISISADVDSHIYVGLAGDETDWDSDASIDFRAGGLNDVLAAEGWTLKYGWHVDWFDGTEMKPLVTVWATTIKAGGMVTFEATKNNLMSAIFASEGTNFINH